VGRVAAALGVNRWNGPRRWKYRGWVKSVGKGSTHRENCGNEGGWVFRRR
jgi:hypothetical protein